MSRPASALLLALATVAAYLPALSGPYIWTDAANVVGTPGLGPWEELWRIWTGSDTEQYFPLTYTSFWLERRVWGLWPAGSHAINVALHVANTGLFMRLLSRLGIPGAWFAGAIFALHPVHVESVAWIVERKNVLSGTFYLLAWLAYLGHEQNAKRGIPAAALGLFAAALLAKSATVTLPVALVLGRLYQRRSWSRREVLALAPFFVLSLGMAAVTMTYEAVKNPYLGDGLPGFGERIAIAGVNVWFYLKTLIAPFHLALVYEKWTLDPGDARSYLPALGVVALLAGLFAMRRRWGDGPLLAFGFYLVTLFPVLGLLPFYYLKLAYAADHFQYLASLSLIALFAAACRKLVTSSGGGGEVRGWALGPAVVLLGALGALTWSQSRLYANEETLWEHTLERSPGSAIVHGMFARAAARRGDLAAAVAHYREEIRLDPRGTRAYVDLGRLQQERGDETAAEASYRAAIRRDPRFPAAHLALARLQLAQGRHREAAEGFARVLDLELTPDRAGVHCERAVALARGGWLGAAEAAYRSAIAIDPDSAPAHLGLAQLRAARGAIAEAVALYRRALALDPGLARGHLGLALALVALGRVDEARGHFERAIEIEPGLRGQAVEPVP